MPKPTNSVTRFDALRKVVKKKHKHRYTCNWGNISGFLAWGRKQFCQCGKRKP